MMQDTVENVKPCYSCLHRFQSVLSYVSKMRRVITADWSMLWCCSRLCSFI